MADFEEIDNSIEELTTTGKDELDRKHTKKLFNLCRKSNTNLEFAYSKIYEQLQEEHSEIRYSAFQIMDKLFLRSHRFRELVLQDAPNVLVVAMGTDQHDLPLPPPLKVAKQLQKMALERLNTWHERFGKGYRLLELAFEFLRDIKKVRFDEMQIRTAADERNTQQANLREKRLIASKLEQVDMQFDDRKESFLSDIKQMKSCFEMIVQKLLDETAGIEESGTSRDPGFLEGNEAGITSHNYTLSLSISQKQVIYETQDNEDAIRRLRELYKENRKHENQAKRWLNVLLKCGSTDKWKIEEILKMKNTLSGLCGQFLDLEIREDRYFSSDDDGEESFIEVPEKVVRMESSIVFEDDEQPTCSRYLPLTVQDKSEQEVLKSDTVTNTNSSSSETPKYNSIREKHLSTAPVIPFDSDLKLWETETGNIDMSSYKSDSLHRFWKTNEHQEHFVPSEIEASMRERSFRLVNKFEPVVMKCGAQLPQGGVCQRMDRYKCPFHGKIVERDLLGRAIHPKDIERDKQLDEQRKEKERFQIQKDIEAATGVSLIKKKRPRVGKVQTRKEIQKKRYARLTNIKKTGESDFSSKKALNKKVFSARSLNSISQAKVQSSHRKHQERFGSNFNY